MKKTSKRILATMSLVIASSVASAQTTASPPSFVTVENYNRAQTDVNFAGVVKNGGFGKFRHGRELAPPAQQGIVRPNRDTLYSFAVVDLDAGPVTITLPDAVKRFMGMQVVNQDQYTSATYVCRARRRQRWLSLVSLGLTTEREPRQRHYCRTEWQS
jgi:hypothetical protein